MPVASFWFGKLVGFTLRTVLNLNKTFLQTIKGAMEGKGWYLLRYHVCKSKFKGLSRKYGNARFTTVPLKALSRLSVNYFQFRAGNF